jgi:O-antigen/teichoic acid export membrane protein
MSAIKQLAGQTILYGASTIAGRLLNYLLVFIHTRVFLPEEYGVVGKLYGYIAFFNVLYSYGMETAFFRFSSRYNEEGKDARIPFRLATTSILVSSFIFSLVIALGAEEIAAWLGYPDRSQLVIWISLILFIDAISAIPFAKLRIDNKPVTFAVAKLGAIGITILLNVFFLVWLPDLDVALLTPLQQMDLGAGYVFLANLLGNAFIPLLLWQTFAQFRPMFEWAQLKSMLAYSWPILVTGLAGMVNEQLDLLLFEGLLPGNFYASQSPSEALGVYHANKKLSVLMMLAIQAFRYAGEPFFFNRASDKNAPVLFARVLHYFVLFSLVIFVGIGVNVNWVGALFLKQEAYLQALYIVPVLLLGKLFFGVYVNLSVWFKLTDKTIWGTYITGIGAAVTILGNLALVPYLGYLGAAVASAACYFVMAVVCYYSGRRFMRIPYQFTPLLGYTVLALILVLVSFRLSFKEPLVNYFIQGGLTLGFVLLIGIKEFLPELRGPR